MEAKRNVKLGIFWEEGVVGCSLLVIGYWLPRIRHPACPVAKRKRGTSARFIPICREDLETGSLHDDANYKDIISHKKQFTHYCHSRDV